MTEGAPVAGHDAVQVHLTAFSIIGIGDACSRTTICVVKCPFSSLHVNGPKTKFITIPKLLEIGGCGLL